MAEPLAVARRPTPSSRPRIVSSDGDEAFVAGFEAGTLSEFHHADHVRLAWLYLRRYPVLEALGRLVTGIRHFAQVKGSPDLYHETITWAYVLLIHERIERIGREASWERFAEANPDLLVWKGGVLERCYRPETLGSDLAKRVFLWPDAVPNVVPDSAPDLVPQPRPVNDSSTPST